MKSRNKRLSAVLLAGAVFVSLITPQRIAFASSNNIVISTAEEFIEFADNCTLDSWSKNKTVTLNADINLAFNEWKPIPVFGGTFNGNGHTVSGVRITSTGSDMGLFRFVEKGGVVEGLNVSGTVMPGGTQTSVGGIIGENRGTVKNCEFNGSVIGEKNVGGVVGTNADSGMVISCSAKGSVRGNTGTGGIAGENAGTLINCENNAGINLTQTNEGSSETDIDKILEDADNDEEENILGSTSDTGGIVGYSDGIVQSCVNRGDVGYPHVGYNTGGIAGRQTGYLSGCVNYGSIYGRKEVGGIVGQAEPYLSVSPDSSLLDELQSELNTLNDMIDGALDSSQGLGNTASAHLTDIKASADIALDSAKNVSDNITDFVDGNINVVNMVTADISNAIDLAKPAADDFSEIGAEISVIADALSDCVEIMERFTELTDAAKDDMKLAADHLKDCAENAKTISEQIGDALDAIQWSVIEDDAEAFKDAAEALKRAIEAAGALSDDTDDVTGSIDDILGEIGGNITDNKDVNDALNDFADAMQKIADSLPTVADDLKNISGKLSGATNEAEKAADNLGKAVGSARDALDDLEPANELEKSALDKLGIVFDHTSRIGKLGEHAFGCVSDALDSLSDTDRSPFKPLGGEVREQSDTLFDALSKMFDEAEELNTDLNSDADAFVGELKAINAQIRVITDLVINEIRSVTGETVSDLNDHIQDTSEEDIAATREGKVADCRNHGSVNGDRNIGGIAGAMAIEYDLDPEDDIANNMSIRARFETKAVVQGCVNYGDVTAKKDCAGGLAGRTELGTLIDGQNYGTISGTDYVGGAAGYANASVRSCYSKCRLSGSTYIGGIAGYAKRLSDCYAITTVVEGKEFIGAVLGKEMEDAAINGNFFVDTGIAGEDGISYSGKAEPITFQRLSGISDIPAEMLSFDISLYADDELIEKLPFSYGQRLSTIALPDVPEKTGNYGVWETLPEYAPSDLVINAEYHAIVTIAQSAEINGKLPLALASGEFTEDIGLSVTEDDIAKPVGAGSNAKIYRLKLESSGLGELDTVPVRLLNPGSSKAMVWIMEDGAWKSVSSEQNGKYMLAEMLGTEAVFCIANPDIAWIPFAVGGATVIAIVIIVLSVRRAKKRKKAKTAVSTK